MSKLVSRAPKLTFYFNSLMLRLFEVNVSKIGFHFLTKNLHFSEAPHCQHDNATIFVRIGPQVPSGLIYKVLNKICYCFVRALSLLFFKRLNKRTELNWTVLHLTFGHTGFIRFAFIFQSWINRKTLPGLDPAQALFKIIIEAGQFKLFVGD